MTAGRALPEKAGGATLGWSRTVGLLNPLRAVWWLFTNVRFAIFLLALLSAVSLLGVLIPQKPLNTRGDVIAESEWLADKDQTFGVLTDPMDAIGLFDVFHQDWFSLLLAVTVASTGAYVVSRFPGAWQAITRPRKRVPDRYFEMARGRVQADAALDPARLVTVLRDRRYRVETFQEGSTTYLFADRFAWAQLGSLLTHAAIIVFILSAVVSRVDAFSSPLFLAEGSALPVFPVRDPDQMQVELLDAHAAFAPDGQPLDYRADLVIHQGGEEVLRCSSTVNSPCSYQGYRFYQAAYFGYGAAVEVRDIRTGNVVYQETLGLAQRSPSPRVAVTDDDGSTVFSGNVLLTDSASAAGEIYRTGLVRLPDGRPVTFWLPEEGGDLTIFEPGDGAGLVRATLAEGQSADTGGLNLTYAALENVPSALVPDFPLPQEAGAGSSGEVLLQMTNVVFGTTETSDGGALEAPAAEGADPELTIVGVQPQPVTLFPGQSLEAGGLEYTFVGQREFSGIDVRRDRSDTLVWLGATLIVGGLMITFWVPRRRLWAKITGARTWLAGQAPGHSDHEREMRDLLRTAGAPFAGRGDEDD